MLWREVAGGQAGVVSREQLRCAGCPDHVIDRMIRSGALEPLARATFLVGGAPLTYDARLWSAVLRTDGTLSHATAGQLWGIVDADPRVHVSIPHARRIGRVPGVVLHRGAVPADQMRTRSGLPVTARRWTVLDLLAELPGPEAGRLADRALQRGWIDRRDLERRLIRFPRRPGNRQLRRLAELTSDRAAATSERVLHRMLRAAGITGWRANHEIWADGRLVAVIDVAFVDARLAVEIDGMAYHVDVDRFRGDRSRQNTVVALGWTVLRFTWADLTDRPGYVLAMISRAVA